MKYECTDNGSSTVCISEASSSPAYYNGFSYDGVVTNTFLILIFVILFLNFTISNLTGIKVQPKKYD